MTARPPSSGELPAATRAPPARLRDENSSSGRRLGGAASTQEGRRPRRTSRERERRDHQRAPASTPRGSCAPLRRRRRQPYLFRAVSSRPLVSRARREEDRVRRRSAPSAHRPGLRRASRVGTALIVFSCRTDIRACRSRRYERRQAECLSTSQPPFFSFSRSPPPAADSVVRAMTAIFFFFTRRRDRVLLACLPAGGPGDDGLAHRASCADRRDLAHRRVRASMRSWMLSGSAASCGPSCHRAETAPRPRAMMPRRAAEVEDGVLLLPSGRAMSCRRRGWRVLAEARVEYHLDGDAVSAQSARQGRLRDMFARRHRRDSSRTVCP